MFSDYIHWQFVLTPRWLVTVVGNLQLALLQLFSVKLMLRTLLTPWHRDVMPFHGGTLGELGITILWNITSRLMGFLFRALVLLIWLGAEALFAVVAAVVLSMAIAWPFLVMIGFATGLALLANSVL